MHEWNLAFVALLLVAFGAVSKRLARSVVSQAMFFVTGGLLLGGSVLGMIDLSFGSESIKLLAEATLTLVLFADASRIDFSSLRREYAVPARLLGVGLPLTIAIGAVAALVIFPNLAIVEAAVLAIVLAPTDAALGQAVVTDRRLPSRISQGLNVESGLNDGICVPLLLIAIALAEAESGSITDTHAVRILAEEIGYGVLGGIVAGVAGRWLVRQCTHRDLAGPVGVRLLTVGAAALAYGLASPIGGSGFIAAFVGGAVFGRPLESPEHEVPEAESATALLDELGQVLSAITFIVFGAAVLGPAIDAFTWQSLVYALLSLTIVRMVPVALSMIGTGSRWPTIGFLGWFGPRGLASIVFAVIIIEDAKLENLPPILLAVVATIGASIFLHGLTAGPLTERYVSWRQKRSTLPMEDVPAAVHRARWQASVSRS